MATALAKPHATKEPYAFAAQVPIPVHTLRVQDPLRHALMDAITRNDPQKIEALINRGAPLYQHYFYGLAGPPCNNPALQKLGMVNPVDWAALNLRFRAAMQILELADGRVVQTEVRPRHDTMEGCRAAAETKIALAIASQHGHLGFVRMLLERGCSVAQSSFDGESALHVAIKAAKDEVVALLLQYGAWELEPRREEVLDAVRRNAVMLQIFEAAGLLQAQPLEESSNIASLGAQFRSIASEEGGGGLVSPRLTRPVVANASARREVWMKEGITHSVFESNLQSSGSSRPNAIVREDWGWSPHGMLPLSATTAQTGGAVSVPMHETPASASRASLRLRELTTEEMMLRGELTRAIRKGDIDKTRGLSARGAPLDAAFDLGYGEQGNCVDWACVNGHPQLALILLELADQRENGDLLAQTGKAAFFWSVTQGYSDVLEELLRRGAPVTREMPVKTLDIWGEKPHSALVAATFGSRKAEVTILLRYGAWSHESEEQRLQLLEWSKIRKPIAEAFEEAGILSATSDYLPPLEKPIDADLSRMNAASPFTDMSTRPPTAEPFLEPYQSTVGDRGILERAESP